MTQRYRIYLGVLLVVAFFAGSLACAGSFRETVQKAIESGKVNPATATSTAVATTTPKLPTPAPTPSPTYTNPDKLTSNPEVDPKGLYTPAKVAGMTGEDLQKLTLKLFNVRLEGGLIGKGTVANGYLWTQKQIWEVYRTLYSLPRFFSSRTLAIRREKIAFNNPNIAGYVWSGIPRVYLCDRSVQVGLFNEVLVHEMLHTFEFTYANYKVQNSWLTTFWKSGGASPKTPPPTAYGNTNYHEDFAESVRTYWANGAAFKAKDPARYEFIRVNVMNGREFRR